MQSKNQKQIVIAIVVLVAFCLTLCVCLIVYLTAGSKVSVDDWFSASKNFVRDAGEFQDAKSFASCPTDDELKKVFLANRKAFEELQKMAVKDNLSSLTYLIATDRDSRIAMYPYVDPFNQGEKPGEITFVIKKERYDKYRRMMKRCKVLELRALGADEKDGIGFIMYNESLEPGKDADDAAYFKRKSLTYWNEADFESYKNTDEIEKVDGEVYGGVQIDSHWFVFLSSKFPPK